MEAVRVILDLVVLSMACAALFTYIVMTWAEYGATPEDDEDDGG